MSRDIYKESKQAGIRQNFPAPKIHPIWYTVSSYLIKHIFYIMLYTEAFGWQDCSVDFIIYGCSTIIYYKQLY